jgi:hypothetical protein
MMTSRRWRWVSARAVLTNLWLTALNQLQPTYVQCPEGRAGSDCPLIKAGTLLNIWLYFITGRVIASARSGKLCVLDLRLDRRLTVPVLALMHALRRGSG